MAQYPLLGGHICEHPNPHPSPYSLSCPSEPPRHAAGISVSRLTLWCFPFPGLCSLPWFLLPLTLVLALSPTWLVEFPPGSPRPRRAWSTVCDGFTCPFHGQQPTPSLPLLPLDYFSSFIFLHTQGISAILDASLGPGAAVPTSTIAAFSAPGLPPACRCWLPLL